MPQRSRLLVLLAFLGIVTLVVAVGWLISEQRRASDLVRHTLEVENRLSDVLTSVQDAETGQRGYLLSGERSFLEPYDVARRELPAKLATLRGLVADNPSQSARARRLTAAVEQRLLRLYERVVDYRTMGRVEPAGLAEGRALMSAVRTQVATMMEAEHRLYRARETHARRILFAVVAGLAAVLAALVVTSVFVVRSITGQIAEIAHARDALARANRDLTDAMHQREAAEAQTRQLQKMEAVGQLTGGIAHDFNNMLAIIVGSLDLAKRRLARGDRAKADESIDHAIDGANRAAQLTQRLMAYSRQQPLNPVATDVNKLVSGMSELLRRSIGEAVRIETVLAGGLWRTMIDPGQLENALVNLAVNGRDAMPGGGRLTIETANAELDDRYAAGHEEVVAGQYVVVSVTDTGTGMTQDVAARVFEPFFTTKEVGKGTGLGLAQVFGFIKQSRGHVKLYSEPGEGTTVKLYLPRASQEAPTVVTAQPVRGAEAAGRGETILVVEDDERVRATSTAGLRELGYQVIEADGGQAALDLLGAGAAVDLVFTDVVMPGMNGRQLADAVAARWPGMRILFTTGYTRNAIVHNGMLDAGVDLLSKPFTVEQLAIKIRAVLDRAR